MDADTVNKIIAMIDSRRLKLDASWREMERGSYESAECLAVGSALADLKWAIVDVWESGGRLPDEDELVQAPAPAVDQ
jgi:hypothetical protein